MTVVDFHRLVENGKKWQKEQDEEWERQKQADTRIPFDAIPFKLGPYVQSEATKARLRQIEEADKKAKEFVANCDWIMEGSTTKT
jgi:hypothetical protein